VPHFLEKAGKDKFIEYYFDFDDATGTFVFKCDRFHSKSAWIQHKR